MSSISSNAALQLGAIQRTPHAHSEKSRLSSAIDGEVANGTLSATDATALTGALGSIDSSLSADAASGTSGSSGNGSTGSSGARLDPSSIKDRIDGLIANQVSSGSLTSDQASELKNLFASQGRGAHGAPGAGGVAGAGNPPPGPPPADAGTPGDSADGSTSAAASTGAVTGKGASSTDLLASFIQQVQASQAGGYAASGTSSTGSQASALLFDFQT